MSTTANIQKHILNSLMAACGKDGFSSDDFFNKWFLQQGQSHFFLFKKNLKVTNIQFAELFASIRCHTVLTDGHNDNNDNFADVHFMTKSRFKHAVTELIRSFPWDEDSRNGSYRTIVQLYARLLKHLIVIDCLHGSCIIYTPRHLAIDTQAICAHAGYIHSCGPCVYINRVDDADQDHFLKSINDYLKSSARPDAQKVFFSVYAHEDFTRFDREQESSLRHGLDDVKIYIEKFYMGSHRLVSVLNEMRSRFKNVLEIPEPGDYRKKHRIFRGKKNVDTSHTMWLIIDHSIGDVLSQAGHDRYFVCYDQRFVNQSPFHIFDENMPAWRAHTTIPHTLAGAMLSITRPWWANTKRVIIADPFAGTGTVPLEMMKFSNIIINAGDIETVAPLLARDNLTFFASNVQTLEKYQEAISTVQKIKHKNLVSPNLGRSNAVGDVKTVSAFINWAIDILDKVIKKSPLDEPRITDDVVLELKQKDFMHRLFFYLGLRTAYRHGAGFERGSGDWLSPFRKEANELGLQIAALIAMRQREQATSIKAIGPIAIYRDNYSVGCTVSVQRLSRVAKKESNNSVVRVKDARTLPADSCDVIVTDPPYGFNTDEDPAVLAELYATMLRTCINALRNEGQLVLCLMDKSHIGRHSAYFTHKEIVTRQVLRMARELWREVIVEPGRMPEPHIFGPPYYWESERALRRSILHFRFRRISNHLRKNHR